MIGYQRQWCARSAADGNAAALLDAGADRLTIPLVAPACGNRAPIKRFRRRNSSCQPLPQHLPALRLRRFRLSNDDTVVACSVPGAEISELNVLFDKI